MNVNWNYFCFKDIATKQKAHLLVSVNIENEYQRDDEKAAEDQQQMLVACELAVKQEMIMERRIRIRQIESDLRTVNEIMKELATLVHDQGEVIGKD